MSFDLFTLAAQIVNFVILVVLLRIFLYAPVRRVMHERERRIEDTRRQADEALEHARAERARLDERCEAWERERRERERALEDEVNERRERRLEAIEDEMEDARTAMAEALARDRDDVVARVRRRSLELLTDELRRALRDLADERLERQAARAFRARLEALGEGARATLRDAAGSEGEVAITTAFELPGEVRDELTAALRDLVGPDAAVRAILDPSLGFGVVLELGGLRVAWTADAYADAFAEAQNAVLTEAVADLRGAATSRVGGASVDA